jgi:hypothetical protein
MQIMPDLININALRTKLRELEAKSNRGNNGTVIVGYSAKYAVFVHENLNAAHGTEFNQKHASDFGKRNKKGQFLKATGTGKKRGEGQQAKFLEQPARTERQKMVDIIVMAAINGKPLLKSLLLAGLYLQRTSQKLVPVDLGVLKASAFTEIE